MVVAVCDGPVDVVTVDDGVMYWQFPGSSIRELRHSAIRLQLMAQIIVPLGARQRVSMPLTHSLRVVVESVGGGVGGGARDEVPTTTSCFVKHPTIATSTLILSLLLLFSTRTSSESNISEGWKS